MKKQYINRKGELVYLDDDDTDVVPDGYGIRTPMFLLDAVQQQIAASTTHHRITDAAGRPAGSRPGFCYDATDNNETQARIAYDAMVARAENNWRGPSTAHAISDATTPEASFAAYQAYLKDAWRTPVADKRRKLDQTPDDDVEAAREAYKTNLSNAWKNTKGTGFGPGSFGG